MLINVACKDRIYRARRNHREVRTRGHDDAHLLICIAPQALCINVKGDFLARANVVDKVAKPRSEVQRHPIRLYIALQVVANRAPEGTLPMQLSVREAAPINLWFYHVIISLG